MRITVDTLVRLLALAAVFAAFGLAAAPAPAATTPDYPLTWTQSPASSTNDYAFDVVVKSRWGDPLVGKIVNPRSVWLMTGLGGATYGDNISSLPSFNRSRCLLRHADGSNWAAFGVNPFNMTLPDCVDFIADAVASFARSYGLYATSWDGIYQDSWSYIPYQYAQHVGNGMTDVDSNLDGQADTEAQLEVWWQAGMDRYGQRLRTDLPGKIIVPNGADWDNPDDLSNSDGTLIEQPIDYIMARIHGWTMQQLVDAGNKWYSANTGRPRIVATMSYWYSGIVSRPSNAAALMESSPDALRRMRFGLAAALMAGMYYDFEYSQDHGSSAVFDEYRGGSLNQQGYLGQPLGATRQITPGVWRRDFERGVAFANESYGTASINVSSEGLHYLKGTENPVLNNGGAAGIVSIPVMDGLILLRGSGSAVGAPQNTALPVVSGSAQAGQTLTASPGSWTNSPTSFAYQWLRCNSSGSYCVDITGAAGQSYGLSTDEVGSAVAVRVTASNAGGSTSARSNVTGVVGGGGGGGTVLGAPQNTALPVVSGSAQAGQTLTASPGSWTNSPTSFAYQWLRCNSSGSYCVDITGAAGQSYGLSTDEVGSAVAVRVTASNAGGSTSARSNVTGVVGGGGGGGTVQTPSSANLVPDPDLEQDPAAAGFYSYGTATFTWASDEAHSPSHSLKIVSSSSGLSRWLTDKSRLGVTPGARYTISAFLKTSGVSSQGAQLAVTYWTASGAYEGTTIDGPDSFAGTVDWRSTTIVTTAPSDAAYARIELRLFGSGTVWADDFQASAS